MSTDLTRLVASIPVFKNMSPETHQFVAAQAPRRTFLPGERVIEQGAPGDEMFIILSGEFKMVVLHEDIGFECEICRLRTHDYFGESAALSGQNGNASVIAVTQSEALVVHRGILDELTAAIPDLAMSLCAGMSQHLELIKRQRAVIAYVRLDDYPVSRTHKLLPTKISRAARALVLQEDGGSVKIGMVNPFDRKARDFLQDQLSHYAVEFVAIGERAFERFAQEYLPEDAPAPSENESISYIEVGGKQQDAGDHQTTEFLDSVLLHGIRDGASDIHFEPGDPHARVRMRVDGNMVTLEAEVPNNFFPRVVSRIKVISDLDITNKRLPQDGRFQVRIGKHRVEIRTAVMPCQGGEKVVLRILDQKRQRLDLKELMFSAPMCDTYREVLRNASGMILVCGPTGSGKTTTLYASLNEIWRATQRVNVVTIEDPVEYYLPYATQIQVNRAIGFDFANALRAVLRQAPDVILVGEIRDRDSANIALETATTGHLVLSSIHTDSTLEAIVRLRKLDVKSYIIASALKCVLSERLVARVCPHCAIGVPITDPAVKVLQEMRLLPQDWSQPLTRGKGCNRCQLQGELGRIGVFEMLMISAKLRDLIERDMPFAELSANLERDNFISMAQYSRLLLSKGLTSPEQVRSIFPRTSMLPMA